MLPKREGHFTDPVKLLEYGLLGHLLLVEKEVTGEFIDLNLWIRAQDADNVTSTLQFMESGVKEIVPVPSQ